MRKYQGWQTILCIAEDKRELLTMKPKKLLGKTATTREEPMLIDHSKASALVRDAELCDKAVEMASRGDYKAAYATLERILGRDSPLRQRAVEVAVKLIDRIVDEYEEEQNYEEAVIWLDKWLTIQPEAIYPAVAKADFLWLHLDRPDEAMSIYRAVVRRRPRCLEGWIGLAQIAISRRQYARGLQYVQRAWGSLSQPTWAYSPPSREVVANVMESLYVLTAKVLAALGKPQEGIDLLQRAMSDWGSSEYLRQHLECIQSLLREGGIHSDP